MPEAVSKLADDYVAAFQEYLAGADETALHRGYELGHDAMARGLQLLDLVAVHHEALAAVLRNVSSPEERGLMIAAAADFFMASLSPFEMTHRGFLEANTTLRRLNQELRHRVREVQEAARRKDEFLAMLAHELRNPLGAVANALQVLHMTEPECPAWQRAMGVVERQVRHQTCLVNDLLDVSRITRGRIELHPERVDLAQLIRETAEDHRAALTDRDLILSLEIPERPVWVEGDPIRLAQVLGNLLQNSAKFTDPGGQVTVTLRSGECGEKSAERDMPAGSPALPTPNSELLTRRAVVTVRDTGIGIEPDMLARVFDTFAQADRSLDRSSGGLGLGLALVKGLVELHGGEVSAHSDGLGCGAEFTFSLPLGGEAASTPVSPAAGATPAGASLRVLVVDDDREFARSLCDLLEVCSHVVRVAHTGATGVEAARQFQPDVVLCDLELPEMDGYAVAAALRQDPITASARLWGILEYGQGEEPHRSGQASFDRHLTKPVDFAELERLLAEMPRLCSP